MPEFSDTIVRIAKVALTRREAQEQGGLLSGQDPSAYNPNDPLRLWIIQVGVIVLGTQLLSLALRKMRQPKVIAEVIGGILLGPTAFGRIPGFTQHVFPQESRPYLSLVANIGLCLFLFLVGLEIDSGVIKRNARLSVTVALAGMTIPFGLGAALAVPLYNKFMDASVKFTHFMLFTGVAYSITAFPVLCRILTELKLLDTTVGIVVLSAGVGNDIVGWTLLALSVALVNAGSGLMALYILLTCVGWTLLLLFPVKFALRWLARRTGSIESGPTMFFMTVTILILFGSAFMTDVIGVHAIFGAFLAGIIVPREGGLAIALTEKLEDMVSIIFLPLYFTLSGLSTDLGLLNNGITWAYTIAICALAYIGKFGGCSLAARYAGFSWRESATIGSLMSCKGLVELIVLNVGLSAGILSQRVFSMFVLEALLLTFMTTPAVVLLYPPHLRMRVSATGANFNNVTDGAAGGQGERGTSSRTPYTDDDGVEKKERFLVVLDRLEHLPAMMSLTQLIQPPPPYSETDTKLPGTLHRSSSDSSGKRPSSSIDSARPENTTNVSISALRLVEITDRTSAVMKYSALSTEAILHSDPLLSIFRTYVELGGSASDISSEVRMVSYDDLAPCIREESHKHSSQMVMIPWVPSIHHHQHHGGADSEGAAGDAATPRAIHLHNPFDTLFKTNIGRNSSDSSSGGGGNSATALYSHFIRTVFAQAETDVALYVDHDSGSIAGSVGLAKGGNQHVFLPFFGGPDDRLALEFVVQVCTANPRVSATIVRVVKSEFELASDNPLAQPSAAHLTGMDEKIQRENLLTVASATQTAFPDTVYGNSNTQTRLQSETADKVTWDRFAGIPETAQGRITFDTLSTPTPLHTIIEKLNALRSYPSANQKGERRPRILLVCGRSRRLAVESHHVELKGMIEEFGNPSHASEVKKTTGDVAAAVILSGTRVGAVVIQAAVSAV